MRFQFVRMGAEKDVALLLDLKSHRREARTVGHLLGET